jgi:hypothetical protein
MGFNIGSTKSRVAWTGDVKRFFFESPLVRLMGDHDTRTSSWMVTTWWRPSVPTTRSLPLYRHLSLLRRSLEGLWRRQDAADRALRQRSKRAHHAPARQGLREQGQQDDSQRLSRASRGPLHGRAGLPCVPAESEARLGGGARAVDKVFTYATPHNGIDMRIVRNVPGWLSFGDINNFNRERMAKYLAVPKGDDVSIVKNFPPERMFNLVGTNARDYTVGGGISAWAAGEASDGLVRIENATTHGPGPTARMSRRRARSCIAATRALRHRELGRGLPEPHALPVRRMRVDGILDIDDITLPVEVQKAHEEGKTVNARHTSSRLRPACAAVSGR